MIRPPETGPVPTRHLASSPPRLRLELLVAFLGGEEREWKEAIYGGYRGLREASYDSGNGEGLAAWHRNGLAAWAGLDSYGFRVASIPEPGTGLLLMTGLLGLARRRKRRIGSVRTSSPGA